MRQMAFGGQVWVALLKIPHWRLSVQGLVGPDTPVGKLRDIFNDDNVAVVKEGDRVTGILTKIDLIDFLGQKLR